MTTEPLFVEENIQNIHINRFPIKRVLFSGQSDFQKVEIVETLGYGKMLLNDGLVMLTERDEFIYHEMMAHVPLFIHPNAKSVLIIGGGDGGTLREVLRHKNIQRCLMVEIDKMVVDACKEHIPLTASAMSSDPRAEVKIQDGVEFVAKTKEKFDVVLIDSTDPIGPATPLFGEAFYKDVKNILNPQGIVIAQGESPFFNQEMQKKLLEIQSKIFSHCHIFNFSNLTYPGGLWSFTYASNEFCPIKDFRESEVSKSNLNFQYYNSGIHKAAFNIPAFQRKNIGDLIGK